MPSASDSTDDRSRTDTLTRHLTPRVTVRLRLTILYGALFLVSGTALLVITYALYAGGRLRGHPGAIGPPPQRVAQMHQFLADSSTALAAVAVVSIWLGWLMAGRVLRPLRVITATARQISEDNLHQRLAMRGPRDELRELGDTFDDLLARLEGAFEAQRRFVANASHELRTPLAMMRTSLDVAERKRTPLTRDASVLAGKIREGLDQADRIVESFLVLARAQQGMPTDRAAVSLPSVASSALSTRTTAITGLNLSIRQRLGDADVFGSETLLTRMVENIIDNAIRYNEPGGIIEVTTEDDGVVSRLIVESGGPLLDQDKVRQLARPFRRLNGDRTSSASGVGLGLSIVAAITTAHHGTLSLRARPQGGLSVVIELPGATRSALSKAGR